MYIPRLKLRAEKENATNDFDIYKDFFAYIP